MEVARVIAGERPVQLVDNVGGRSHLLVHVGACDPDVAVLHALNCDNSAFLPTKSFKVATDSSMVPL